VELSIQCGACRRRYGMVPVGPGVYTVATPGLKNRDSLNEVLGVTELFKKKRNTSQLMLN